MSRNTEALIFAVLFGATLYGLVQLADWLVTLAGFPDLVLR